MAVPEKTIWEIDPHTIAKHDILKRYLEAWFPILNKFNERIIYVDGFCGPGRYKNGEDGSPLIALDVAASHRKAMQGEIIFWFIDSNPDRIKHLKNELTGKSIPAHFKVSTECGKFHEVIAPILDHFENAGSKMPPTFAFVDPFGFSGIPYSLITRLLKQPHCEVLVTFMVDAVNRWLEHPDKTVVNHIIETFGTEEAVKIAQKADNSDRISQLRILYQNQLGKAAQFVRYFEMRDRNNRTIYYLFFASNHPLGHLKMKEAMWRTDPDGEFMFSDATNPNQMILFEQDSTPQVLALILDGFGGQHDVKCEHVKSFIEDKTRFLEKHMKAALRSAEQSEQIKVANQKTDGKKRRANSFPDEVIVSF